MTPDDADTNTRADVSGDTLTLRLVAETAHIAKRRVLTDRVRVDVVPETHHEVLHATLDHETLTVERRPVEYVVERPPPLREEGDVTILSVVEERAVVTKVLMVVEEIHIRRSVATAPVTIPVELRRERADIARGLPQQPLTTAPEKDPEA